MVFLPVSVAWMILALDVSVEIRTVRIGEPEGKRVLFHLLAKGVGEILWQAL